MELTVYEGEQVMIRTLIRSGKLGDILSHKIGGQEVGFVEFLRRTLSLKPTEENAEKIAMVAWLFDEHCGGMTIEQVKKAVLAYVMNKLPIKPRSNYFDAILFSQIIEEYKKTLPPKKQRPYKLNLSEKELSSNSEMNAKFCWNEYLETGRIKPGYAFYWDDLKKAGLINIPKIQPEKALEMAMRRHEEEKNLSVFDRIPSEVNKEYLRTVFKRIVMEEHFKKWHEEGTSLLEKIKR